MTSSPERHPRARKGRASDTMWAVIMTLGVPIILVSFCILFPLLVLTFTWAALRGMAGVFSGHDVVQLADGEMAGIALASLVAAAYGLGRVTGVVRWKPPSGAGALILLPLIAIGAFAGSYGLGWVLQARGYTYCTFHLTGRNLRGTPHGTSVYVRAASPGLCAAARSAFPPNVAVPGMAGAFDSQDFDKPR